MVLFTHLLEVRPIGQTVHSELLQLLRKPDPAVTCSCLLLFTKHLTLLLYCRLVLLEVTALNLVVEEAVAALAVAVAAVETTSRPHAAARRRWRPVDLMQ